MQILKTPEQVYAFVWGLRRQGASVGVVPTMGALHAGHLSLVNASQQYCDHSVATIFVNPTQFAPGEDLDKYPRTLEADLEGLAASGAAAVFLPEPQVIYPPGYSTAVLPPDVARCLEGQYRPEHFQGVATIVLKLFHLIPATHAFFGQKDYQQLRVIESMVRDLNVPIEIIGCPIVRDPDGLAMSSRNRYLNPSERSRALRLSQALDRAESQLATGETDPRIIEQQMRSVLDGGDSHQGVDSIDYATVVDWRSLQPVDKISGAVVALIAAHVGSTRLIDNRLWPRTT
ncbi:pantoate--beta-alanine ligase [Stieleria sp. TO1_6]|uniref:pantoate--beta-alanine ligase n=1 Tax=Stieleria tagensis TaxID=2956795 RepID=UPI00209B0B2D|nr:pantoate--beta-alanine ligase [Stieleria tagensis]MCO8120647.1 pantoate--beta-alanine ligase [Stieleria tagensis]